MKDRLYVVVLVSNDEERQQRSLESQLCMDCVREWVRVVFVGSKSKATTRRATNEEKKLVHDDISGKEEKS